MENKLPTTLAFNCAIPIHYNKVPGVRAIELKAGRKQNGPNKYKPLDSQTAVRGEL